MNPGWFKGKRITVFGIGTLGGGVGTIRYLEENGAHVIATDLKSKAALEQSLDKLSDLKNVTYILGQHRREDFINVDMVIKTPSCPWTNEHVKLALAKGIPVETDASLFFQLCKQPIIGVTGTKGKTTTARMIYHMLKKGRVTPVLFGVENISILDRLSFVKKNTIVVFELSSWRLSALKYCKISPHIAVFTNLFPDHMNYYKSMEAYFNDKKQIYLHQKPKDYLIYNACDENLKELDAEAPSILLTTSNYRITSGRGVFSEDEYIYYNDGIDAKKFMPIEETNIRGEHNLNNLMCAIAACLSSGMDKQEVREGIDQIPQVPHRLETVRKIDGIEYVNDTAATNPQAARVGVESFEQPVVLICGGTDKNLTFENFAQTLKSVKAIIFFKGSATDKMIAAYKKSGSDMKIIESAPIVSSMQEAVDEANKQAERGDVVLLSPGAASFGLFENEFDRGNQFKSIVKKIAS